MFIKILIPVLLLLEQLLFAWYGNFSGKLPARGSFLGFNYDSILVRAVLTQLQYIWLLILANAIFTLAWHFGFLSYKSFLIVATLNFAAAALAIFLFNFLFLKETVDWVLMVGIILVTLGAVTVVGHREIMGWF